MHVFKAIFIFLCASCAENQHELCIIFIFFAKISEINCGINLANAN